MDNLIDEFLNKRIEDNNLRTLIPISSRNNVKIIINNKEYIDFSSNDYLGLSSHPEMIERGKKAYEKYGASSTGSRLLSGDSDLFHELEDKIAEFKNKEAGLIFNSGYQANVGIISTLCEKGDIVFLDKLSHASIIDGVLLSSAKLMRFKHNDMEHLENLLKKERSKYRDALIISESIFSMDGDKAPLKELVDLKNKYNCHLMVDEAHATGIFGKNGAGLVEEEGLSDQMDLIMGTFGKALGSFGAYLACSDKIKQFLINKCRSFIYSTALPPSVIACNIKSMELVKKEPFRRKKLLETAKFFKESLLQKGIKIKSDSQIIPIVVGDNKNAIKLSNKMKENGFLVMPIRYPTVPKGKARIRLSLTYNHENDVLKKIMNLL